MNMLINSLTHKATVQSYPLVMNLTSLLYTLVKPQDLTLKGEYGTLSSLDLCGKSVMLLNYTPKLWGLAFPKQFMRIFSISRNSLSDKGW